VPCIETTVCNKLATELQDNKHEQTQLLRQLVDRIEVGNAYVSLSIKPTALIVTEFEDANKCIALKTNV
jgi:hypothetical protein